MHLPMMVGLGAIMGLVAAWGFWFSARINEGQPANYFASSLSKCRKKSQRMVCAARILITDNTATTTRSLDRHIMTCGV